MADPLSQDPITQSFDSEAERQQAVSEVPSKESSERSGTTERVSRELCDLGEQTITADSDASTPSPPPPGPATASSSGALSKESPGPEGSTAKQQPSAGSPEVTVPRSFSGSDSLSPISPSHERTVSHDGTLSHGGTVSGLPEGRADDQARTALEAEKGFDGDGRAGGPGAEDEAAEAGFQPHLDNVFRGYRIVDELPRGGQAVVYKGLHEATGTYVALKVLLPSLIASERARRYFEREAELVASLSHPNIVKIRDSGISHGQYFFAMEYIEGVSLDRYIRTHDLSFRDRLKLFCQICRGVTYAHQHGVIHRDLKSSNILVDEFGEPHILDFGLAKITDTSELGAKYAEEMTTTGQWSGSIPYMSPEQASGRSELIDTRSDVYSLGALLYLTLLGRYPHNVDKPTLEALQEIKNSDPVRPSKLMPGFDKEMEVILLTALEKERDQRYQTVAAFQSDIENWLAGLPISVRAFSSYYLMKKMVLRHKASATIVGLLAVIIVCFGIVSFLFYLDANAARKQTAAFAEDLQQEYAERMSLARIVTFDSFLVAWEQDQREHAMARAVFLAEDRPFLKAGVGYLMDPRPVAAKEEALLAPLREEYPAFADYVKAVHVLKDGDRSEAVRLFQACVGGLEQKRANNEPPTRIDRWLRNNARVRLSYLTGNASPSGLHCETGDPSVDSGDSANAVESQPNDNNQPAGGTNQQRGSIGELAGGTTHHPGGAGEWADGNSEYPGQAVEPLGENNEPVERPGENSEPVEAR